MVKIKEFRYVNHLKQKDLMEFWNVGNSFMSNIETGRAPIPADKLSMLLDNDRGWDVSMIRPEDNASISVNASGNSRARVFSPGDDSTAPQMDVLLAQIDMLKSALKEEKARSERYLQIIEKMTK